jgi:DNA-binding CsgD family transcriptional regulator
MIGATAGTSAAQSPSLLDHSLESDGIAVCVTDAQQRILQQSKGCEAICGPHAGELCQLGCMELYAADQSQQWRRWGSRVYKNSLIHGAFYDVTVMCSSEHIVTFLQPLAEQYNKAQAFYSGMGLTARESEIIVLTVQGVSNANISERLCISHATLRTHLNNIYSKLRDQGEIPRFIPANRGVL